MERVCCAAYKIVRKFPHRTDSSWKRDGVERVGEIDLGSVRKDEGGEKLERKHVYAPALYHSQRSWCQCLFHIRRSEEEFGSGIDPLAIGAISIARRLQDPLSELVKIPPQSIGVGMYQHDISEKKLGSILGDVTSQIVSDVGVLVNSASVQVLAKVSGLSSSAAKKIFDHVRSSGPLRARSQLLNIKGIGSKTFEQCAGFLRIPDSDCPLDNTNVHPESYSIARDILRALCYSEENLSARNAEQKKLELPALTETQLSTIAEKNGTTPATVSEIWSFLSKPGSASDPRSTIPAAVTRRGPMEIQELKPGMVLPGTISNVTSFGTFVDLGVGKHGLLHAKAIPRDAAIGAGARVSVRVISIDVKRGRISLALTDSSSRQEAKLTTKEWTKERTRKRARSTSVRVLTKKTAKRKIKK